MRVRADHELLTRIHYHMKPETQQVYRLAAVAAAVAVDLGLNRRPRKSQQQQMNVESITTNPQGMTPTGPDYWNVEARRAYLGCYYIATTYVHIQPKLLSYLDNRL